MPSQTFEPSPHWDDDYIRKMRDDFGSTPDGIDPVAKSWVVDGVQRMPLYLSTYFGESPTEVIDAASRPVPLMGWVNSVICDDRGAVTIDYDLRPDVDAIDLARFESGDMLLKGSPLLEVVIAHSPGLKSDLI